jgi:outer membrane lipoprotein-sorting protein
MSPPEQSGEPSAEAIASQFLERSDGLTAYHLNATVAVFEYPGFHTYTLDTYAVRPVEYYLEWSDPEENITEVFIVNGTDNVNTLYWRVLPEEREAYYAQPFSSEYPAVSMNSYDILWFVSDQVKKNPGAIVRNTTVDSASAYGIEVRGSDYAGMQDCTIVFSINRSTALPERMQVYGSTGSLQQEIVFNGIDTDPHIPAGMFDYSPPENFHSSQDLFHRPFPFDRLYYAALNIGSGRGQGLPMPTTPVTTPVLGGY